MKTNIDWNVLMPLSVFCGRDVRIFVNCVIGGPSYPSSGLKTWAQDCLSECSRYGHLLLCFFLLSSLSSFFPPPPPPTPPHPFPPPSLAENPPLSSRTDSDTYYIVSALCLNRLIDRFVVVVFLPGWGGGGGGSGIPVCVHLTLH